MFFFTAASFMILGVATLWSLRVIFGGTRWAANNTIALSLSITGWVLILLGLAFVAPFGIVLVLIVCGMTVARFRHAERRALLWTLSLAAEKGIPLSPSVRAFAARRSDEMARRALELADQLDAGISLSRALSASGNPLPIDTELMVRLSANSKTTAAALRESGEFGDEIEQAWMPIFGQIAYLLLIALCTVLMFTFIMVKIMPTFRAIFDDFGMQLPGVTLMAIEFSGWFASYYWLFTPLIAYLIGSLLVAGFFYARGRIWLPPPFTWLFQRSEKPTLLRGLAVCVEQENVHPGRPSTRLSQDYPSRVMRERLAACRPVPPGRGENWLTRYCAKG